MSVTMLNRTAVKEAKDIFFQTSNSGHLTDKDLLILVLQPLMRERSLSLVADEILEKGIPYLSSLSEFELSTLFGLKEKQSFHLMAVFELARRLNKVKWEDKVIIRSPQDVARVCSDLAYLDKEHFVCLYLNTKCRIIGRETISVGSLNASIVHPREVFKAAMRRGADSIICIHNHPSGIPDPSPEDIEVTKRLLEAGELVGIKVLDHVVIGGDRHVSLKEEGHI